MEYAVLALVILVAIVLILLYLRKNAPDGFSPYYELPRRDPQQFVRHPLEFQK